VFTGAEVLAAFARAYPDRTTLSQTPDGPRISVAGRVFAWAEGRLLPEAEWRQWPDFAPQTVYEYPAELPDVGSWSADRLALAEARLANRQAEAVKRDPRFFDTLWGCFDLPSAQANQRQIRFLGLAVQVHRLLREPLARIETRLTAARAVDPGLDAFLKTLGRLDGYNWRVIAGTQSRSNHAYGTALDVVPRSYGGKNPYWLWAPQGWDGWYRQAWKRAWQPHPAFVRAFEDEGFVWGGKWLLFDTIHFEYRPEILGLNGLR